MTSDLFSAGFAWDDVAPAATPPATRQPAPVAAAAASLSQVAATPAATLDAPSFTGGFAWPAEGVASVAGVAKADAGGEVSQCPVAVPATPAATSKSADFRAVQPPIAPAVANVASVANWAAGVERMARGYCPGGLRETEWRQMVMDARSTLQNWGADFIALGWTTLEVFGVNRNPRARRLDIPGLVYLLHGRPVEAIDRNTATIRANSRDCLTFQRELVAPGGIPVWEWAAEATR